MKNVINKGALRASVETKTKDKTEQISALSIMASFSYKQRDIETAKVCYDLIIDLISEVLNDND